MPRIWGNWKKYFFSWDIESKLSVQTLISNSCMDRISWAGILHDIQLLLLPKCDAMEGATASLLLSSASETQHQTILISDSFRGLGGAPPSFVFQYHTLLKTAEGGIVHIKNNRRSSLSLELLTRVPLGRTSQGFERITVICACWG